MYVWGSRSTGREAKRFKERLAEELTRPASPEAPTGGWWGPACLPDKLSSASGKEDWRQVKQLLGKGPGEGRAYARPAAAA